MSTDVGLSPSSPSFGLDPPTLGSGAASQINRRSIAIVEAEAAGVPIEGARLPELRKLGMTIAR
jgi:hypothetical protein